MSIDTLMGKEERSQAVLMSKGYRTKLLLKERSGRRSTHGGSILSVRVGSLLGLA